MLMRSRHHHGAQPDEHLITVLAVPAALDRPPAAIEIDRRNLAAFQGLVGGSVEVVTLQTPEMGLYLNEEGKNVGLPLNRRATALTWAHHPGLQRTRDHVVGDTVLVGPVGDTGYDTSVPAEIRELLTVPARVQVQIMDDETTQVWEAAGNEPDWFGGYLWGLPYVMEAAQRGEHRRLRVVPTMSTGRRQLVMALAQQTLAEHRATPESADRVRILTCPSLADLATQIRRGGIRAGAGFHHRSLVLINLARHGESWIAIQDGVVFDVPALVPLARTGGLEGLIRSILATAAGDTGPGAAPQQ
ncbi:DUF3846 domain-containing protein [Kineosporia sp. J2-2]|uniref:DUF3846 domain-containing protein n=1 Tax=Kineosporia corallincola TaxID=2835133 RepID=A0ABS5TPF1_9ACTN|nr:DUF3846 domain-containing protein [Kineosporia corallincola]MBT0772962.1 DUF3846 domain-containing protein [Kineosporia corallincola]